MSRYFVKFVPWNANTITSLINKTIKFSTVHEFNDINEYIYVGHRYKKDKMRQPTEEKILSILEKEMKNLEFLNNLKKLSRDRCNEKYRNKIDKFLKECAPEKLLDKRRRCLMCLEENLAFCRVGIFCVSDLKVFEDDSAQLMFAHYAQNLSGVALIYEVENGCVEEIEYKRGIKCCVQPDELCLNYYKGEYKEMKCFLSKSEKWGYEKEYRVFAKPGVVEASKHGITLKAILYTPRFAGDVSVISKTNHCYYGNNLIINEIYPSHSQWVFNSSGGERAVEFLRAALNIPAESPKIKFREHFNKLEEFYEKTLKILDENEVDMWRRQPAAIIEFMDMMMKRYDDSKLKQYNSVLEKLEILISTSSKQ